MNKSHAAALRKPSATPGILAALQHTVAWPSIGGSAQSPAIPRSALKWSSCLTSGPTLPPPGSAQRVPLYDPAATLMGIQDAQTVQRAQIPLQREPATPPTVMAKSDHDGCEQPQTLSPAQIPMQPEARPPSTLRNGNPRGNPNAAPRCGAKSRAGCPCKGPAMKNGRCRMHGGASTGPSAEGRARIAAARTIHGRRTAAMREHNRTITAIVRRGAVLTAMVRAGLRLEDLAEPIRQCRSGPPPPREPSTAERDRSFVMRELTAMAFSAAEVRSLRKALGAGARTRVRRASKIPAQIPMQREPLAKPPRHSPTCQRPRQPLPCRRLDPANPFPARANPHATWGSVKTPTSLATARYPDTPRGTCACQKWVTGAKVWARRDSRQELSTDAR